MGNNLNFLVHRVQNTGGNAKENGVMINDQKIGQKKPLLFASPFVWNSKELGALLGARGDDSMNKQTHLSFVSTSFLVGKF